VINLQTIGIRDLEAEDNLQIYPVPSSDQFTISGPSVQQVNIYSLEGRLVQSLSQPTSNQVSIKNLSSGVYFVAIVKAGKTYSRKLVVSH
jgi:hypothetical protein